MRKICVGLNCSVYVFGNSATHCPGCGEEGKPMTEEQDTRFVTLYLEVRES